MSSAEAMTGLLEAQIIMKLVDGCESKQQDGDLTHPVMVSVSEAAHILAEWFDARLAAAEKRTADQIAEAIEALDNIQQSMWYSQAIKHAAAAARSVPGTEKR